MSESWLSVETLLALAEKHYIVSAVVLLCLLRVCCCGCGIPMKLDFKEHEGHKVMKVESEKQWRDALLTSSESGTLVVLDMYALWCPPCASACPVFGKMSTEYEDVSFMKADIDAVPAIKTLNAVRAMPTFILFRGGLEVDRCVGFSENAIRAMLQRHRQ